MELVKELEIWKRILSPRPERGLVVQASLTIPSDRLARPVSFKALILLDSI